MILSYLIVIFLSALKFMIGIVTGIAYNFSFTEQLICTGIGGLLGTILYTYFGITIKNWIQKKWPPKSEINTKPNAFAVKVWNYFGMPGLAIITPTIISQPVGCVLALSFGANRLKTMIFVGVSTLIWAFVFAYFGQTAVNLIKFW